MLHTAPLAPEKMTGQRSSQRQRSEAGRDIGDAIRAQNLPSGMLRRLTRNGAAPQSQIAHTNLMFPLLLHTRRPYLTRLWLCRSKHPSCLVDHALSTCGHVDPKHGIITSGRALTMPKAYSCDLREESAPRPGLKKFFTSQVTKAL